MKLRDTIEAAREYSAQTRRAWLETPPTNYAALGDPLLRPVTPEQATEEDCTCVEGGDCDGGTCVYCVTVDRADCPAAIAPGGR